ncbi:UNVERIFIED_CONTAM: D-alanine-D-alanine ligase [Lysinibacillus xylanilyticus]
MKKRVYVLYGGKSCEHEVSVESALNIINELDKNKYDVFALYINNDGIWTKPFQIKISLTASDLKQLATFKYSQIQSLFDFFVGTLNKNSIVFPVIHGTYGEDGKIQGMLEMFNIPYVGNGVGASSIAMDKILSKKLFDSQGIPQAKFISFSKKQFQSHKNLYVQLVEEQIGFPCFVKPANMGSSIGISRCITVEELLTAIDQALHYDHMVLIEEEIKGKEVLVALTGNEEIRCSLPGEWQRSISFFNYEDKYMDDELTPIIPAVLPQKTYENICSFAKKAYETLGCSGMLRADFFITKNHEIYLNEVNTIPGFTQHSMFPLLFQKSENKTYSELLDYLIDLGYSQHKLKNSLQYIRG